MVEWFRSCHCFYNVNILQNNNCPATGRTPGTRCRVPFSNAQRANNNKNSECKNFGPSQVRKSNYNVERRRNNNAAAQRRIESTDMVQTRRCSFSVPSLPSSSPSSRPAKVIENGMMESARNQRRLQSETLPTMTLNFPPKPPRAPNTNSRIRNPVVMKLKTSPLIPIVPSQPVNPIHSSPLDHFLCGVNLENCSDLLSIPDPPSPESQRKRNKRRESSPLMRPLQDLTNSGLSESLQKKRSRRSISTLPSPQQVADQTDKQKREVTIRVDSEQPQQPMHKRRKSLCHVPSPHLSATVPTADTPSLIPPLRTSPAQSLENTMSTADHTKHHNKPIVTMKSCLDPLLDIKRKGERKRQSFFLPNDMYADESNNGGNSVEFMAANEYFRSLMSYKSNKTRPAKNHSEGSSSENDSKSASTFRELPLAAGSKEQGKTSKHDMKSKQELEMDEIKRLAREYCSLPTVERDTSSYSCDIERLTGYPLIPPTLKIRQMSNTAKLCNNVNPSESPNKAQLDIENRRALLLSMGPVVTRLDQKKHDDVALLEKHTDCKVTKSRNNKYRYVHIPTGQRLDPNEYKYRYLDALGAMKNDIRSSIRHFLHEHGQIQGTKPHEVFVTSAAISDSKDDTTRIGISGRAMEEGRPGDEMDLDESKFHTNVRMCNGTSIAIEQGDSKVQGQEKYRPQTTPTNGLILPLPSRDEISSDPQVAAVEIKLWNSIDVALSIYSKELLVIRSRNVVSINADM